MMKKLLYGLVCCCSLAYGQNQDTSDVLMLNDDWSFSQVGTEKWLPATVPGTVHQDLIHHKLLPDRSSFCARGSTASRGSCASLYL